jgi:hypothetical protein
MTHALKHVDCLNNRLNGLNVDGYRYKDTRIAAFEIEIKEFFF